MSSPELKGRTAVITGASRGIGAGLAESFAGHGMRLGLCSRSAPVLPGGDDVVSRIVDVRDEAGMQRFTDEVVERFGAIDLWINNAGVLAPIAPLRDIELEAFREHIDINLSGVFLGSRCYVRHVRSHEGPGVLINVSSGAAWGGYAGWSAYCAGKAGVALMTQCIALEEASAGLRAHAVAPGVVDTDMQAMIRSSSAEDFPSLERFLELKRDDGFNSIGFVASFILALAFDLEQQTDEVDIRVPNEKE
ncbi:MAG: SDR family NAD(P)-dependent oxidoreductase [Deltaproteobacteria bacterium]|nr:SDR family NAD(P)-dependent oxidoreductase [Deltaproteobacteria bacterium]MBW2723065.1 SDR family NAD(P)-dependent oxidoreductase [Deltaproteobacteria bacterium]